MGNLLGYYYGTEPIKPVLLRNKHINGYLVLANSKDSERTQVTVAKNIVSNGEPNVFIDAGPAIVGDCSAQAAKWRLVPQVDNGTFEIIHDASNEPLYAASDRYAFNEERRQVFTWKQGPSVTQGFWKLEKCTNGFYRIRNTEHNAFLYAADYPKQGSLFTWKSHDNNDDKFYWQVLENWL